EISLSAIETEDGSLVSAAVRDVTDRVKAQLEQERLRAEAERERLQVRLNQAERLESLGQLAGGVAHDFNNLLAVILNYTSFVRELVDEAAARDDAQWGGASRDLAQVAQAATRGAQLTRQLLTFGRRDVVQPEVLDLNAIVSDVRELLQRSIGEQIELRATLDASLWRIVADRGQLEQVLLNLAVNARDAMPDGGVLTIDTENLSVDDGYASMHAGVRLGHYVRLRVSDTGTGMSPDVLDRVFEPFFTTKAPGEGTGLGLATVYGIVSQAGGVARFYSEAGLGTTFTALFPATDETASEAPTHAAAPVSRATHVGTVLIVEDEPAMLEVTRRMLTRRGYEVLTAASGADAIRVATEHEGAIDLLLTDVVMPKMLGAEVAERIRVIQPDISVVFMSGYAQPVLTDRGTLGEGVILLEKPFTEAALLEKLREARPND
ncbi:MAG TPA: response regulator, partial [Acidimicrobiales bacterium]|nr:response regulator [Acidimicrobiales bacterium]